MSDSLVVPPTLRTLIVNPTAIHKSRRYQRWAVVAFDTEYNMRAALKKLRARPIVLDDRELKIMFPQPDNTILFSPSPDISHEELRRRLRPLLGLEYTTIGKPSS